MAAMFTAATGVATTPHGTTIDDLHCYFELVELLQWHGRDVHSGHRRCYNATWELLPKYTDVATMTRRHCYKWSLGLLH
jgi:hypothetical protein